MVVEGEGRGALYIQRINDTDKLLGCDAVKFDMPDGGPSEDKLY